MAGQAALDHLIEAEELPIDRAKIVLFGHSLGGSVALHLAADNPTRCAAVIVENAFLKVVRLPPCPPPRSPANGRASRAWPCGTSGSPRTSWTR